MPKIKIDLTDPETKAIWDAALEARREVEAMPGWKRNDYVDTLREDITSATRKIMDLLNMDAPLTGEAEARERWAKTKLEIAEKLKAFRKVPRRRK